MYFLFYPYVIYVVSSYIVINEIRVIFKLVELVSIFFIFVIKFNRKKNILKTCNFYLNFFTHFSYFFLRSFHLFFPIWCAFLEEKTRINEFFFFFFFWSKDSFDGPRIHGLHSNEKDVTRFALDFYFGFSRVLIFQRPETEMEHIRMEPLRKSFVAEIFFWKRNTEAQPLQPRPPTSSLHFHNWERKKNSLWWKSHAPAVRLCFRYRKNSVK